MPKRATVADVRDENRQLAGNLELLSERLVELEAEDVGWTRLGQDSEREFSRTGLTSITKLSRYMYLKNPLINRAVNVQAYYVWGQGVNIQAEDPDVNEVVQSFLDDPKNQAELTSHQARTLKEIDLQVLGNLFFVFFVDAASGAVTVRTIPADEVQDIICNPEDAKDPWYYKRVWTQTPLDGTGSQAHTAYYPDWRLDPVDARKRATFRDGEIMDTPVYHVKVGGLSDMRFGVPETYQALDWARAYKEFLEDRATIARALSKFVFRLTTKGGSKGVAAAKTKLGTTLGTTSTETNPPPVSGSTFIGSAGVELDPIRVAGATISPEEGRRFLLMVAAAMGLPETFFGDVSVGTLATATSLDRPSELKFRDRQQLWDSILTGILQFALGKAIAAPASTLSADVDRHIDVDFPPLLEHDPEARIKAIVMAATLDGKPSAGTLDDRTLVMLLLQALGVNDVDEVLEKIAPADGESMAAQVRGQKATEPTATEAAMVEAVREMRAQLAGTGAIT